MAHSVRLPHPDKTEPTVGTCDCGWTVVYGWGGHGAAVLAAGEHIEQAARAEWVEVAQFGGERRVMPGRSL